MLVPTGCALTIGRTSLTTVTSPSRKLDVDGVLPQRSIHLVAPETDAQLAFGKVAGKHEILERHTQRRYTLRLSSEATPSRFR
jgi:hypothetical protein